MDSPDWVAKNRRIWETKPALRDYYRDQIFARIGAEVVPGRTLELGSGPGFLAESLPGIVTSDIAPAPGIAVCADAHALPFADASFANVVGVDVLHHFARPGLALGEIARVLGPGGRLVVVEPWASPFGHLFYRYIHHEACRHMDDPWRAAIRPDKAAMDGNAMIPRSVFRDRISELAEHAPGLRLVRLEAFGFLAFLMTGGFRSWSFPPALVRAMTRIEQVYPRRLNDLVAVRVFLVLEKAR
jgi:SAM-dependent methyltransferase